jgi:hypothetical protein
LDYDATSVREIHVRLHGGDDALNAQPRIAQNILAYAGAGNDRMLSGAGSDWLVGGAGDDFIAGRGNRDLIDGDEGLYDSGGDDTLVGGANQDTLLGYGGNDKLVGGPGRDITDGGQGADIVDGGQDEDLVWGGKGPDRIVNAADSDEARDVKSEDMLLAAMPEELIFAELLAEDADSIQQDGAIQQSTSLDGATATEGASLSDSSSSYGYNGTVGPFWLEPINGIPIYQPEGQQESTYPFTLRRGESDQFGADVSFQLAYSGTAVNADFTYPETSVLMTSGTTRRGLRVDVYDDPTLESTEDFSVYFGSAVVPSDPGAFVIIDYPATNPPSVPPSDPDGDPYSATAYIVDGNVTIYDENGMSTAEAAEQNPGISLDIGKLHRLDVATSHSPVGANEFALWYDGSLAIWRDLARTD